jgi:hypothetical protein
MAFDLQDQPNRVPWPPSLGAAALALGALAERAYPVRRFSRLDRSS